ncbi:MAG: AAA family ATPase [Burkholderiales bacterium]|nr:AAA family ATPase [Burkholderiales bacterium]
MSGYKQFHGLSGPLFGKGLGPGALLVYPQLQELEDELEVLVEEGGVGVLSGEMGMGKTTALRHYIDQRSDRNVQALYHGSSRHSTALLEALAEGLGVAPARHRAALLRQVGQQVERTWHEQRRKTLVILDGAHLLEDALLEDLRLLTNFEMDTADPLVLVLSGHPALRKRLTRPVHLALWDRVRLHYRLEGLSREETSEYIDRHLNAAKGSPDLFTAEARDALFERAQGIPRRINSLARDALKRSARRGLTPVDAGLVEEAARSQQASAD